VRERKTHSVGCIHAHSEFSFCNICLGLLSVINVAVIENYFHFYVYHYLWPLQRLFDYQRATCNTQPAMGHGYSLNAFTFTFTFMIFALRFYHWGIIVYRDLSALFISFLNSTHSHSHTYTQTHTHTHAYTYIIFMHCPITYYSVCPSANYSHSHKFTAFFAVVVVFVFFIHYISKRAVNWTWLKCWLQCTALNGFLLSDMENNNSNNKCNKATITMAALLKRLLFGSMSPRFVIRTS